eukprot:5207299-Pyramimonas_sp.AAC.1
MCKGDTVAGLEAIQRANYYQMSEFKRSYVILCMTDSFGHFLLLWSFRAGHRAGESPDKRVQPVVRDHGWIPAAHGAQAVGHRAGDDGHHPRHLQARGARDVLEVSGSQGLNRNDQNSEIRWTPLSHSYIDYRVEAARVGPQMLKLSFFRGAPTSIEEAK